MPETATEPLDDILASFERRCTRASIEGLAGLVETHEEMVAMARAHLLHRLVEAHPFSVGDEFSDINQATPARYRVIGFELEGPDMIGGSYRRLDNPDGWIARPTFVRLRLDGTPAKPHRGTAPRIMRWSPYVPYAAVTILHHAEPQP